MRGQQAVEARLEGPLAEGLPECRPRPGDVALARGVLGDLGEQATPLPAVEQRRELAVLALVDLERAVAVRVGEGESRRELFDTRRDRPDGVHRRAGRELGVEGPFLGVREVRVVAGVADQGRVQHVGHGAPQETAHLVIAHITDRLPSADLGERLARPRDHRRHEPATGRLPGDLRGDVGERPLDELVVVVEDHDEVVGTLIEDLFEQGVPGAVHAPVHGRCARVDARVLREHLEHVARPVGRAVVVNEEMPGRVVLGAQRMDGAFQALGPILGRRQDRERRLLGCGGHATSRSVAVKRSRAASSQVRIGAHRSSARRRSR